MPQPPDSVSPRDDTAGSFASTGLEDLHVARALWFLREHPARLAIDAATRALVEGHDGQPLRQLAGERPDVNPFELGSLIDHALASVGATLAELTRDTALHICAVHYAKRVLEGTLTVRELTSWAHREIGHEGPAWGAELVELDDEFDDYTLGGIWAREPEWQKVIAELVSTPLPTSTQG